MHLFYQPNAQQELLEGEEARHCARVLRLGPSDIIWVTDGRGKLYKANLTQVKEKQVRYTILDTLPVALRPYKLSMVVAPTRKAERNEWMVEKMVELGVDEIHFVLTEHTHHESVRRVVNQERLERIAVAAMKQSQQVMVPDIQVYNSFAKYLSACQQTNRFIAYVTDTDIPPHLLKQIEPGKDIVVLIGPEGDFSPEEIALAMTAGFRPVSLGETRLRTETAAVMACHSAHLAQLM